MSTAYVLKAIHSDRSVQTCLELSGLEEDQETRIKLLDSAILNFSPDAVEPVRQFILQATIDPDVIDLRADLLAACKIMNVSFPEYDAWLEESKNDQAFRMKWHAEHPPAWVEDPDEDAELDRDFTDELSEEDGYDDDSPAPYVREEERVGRNDPCPCGSGKKFKKCCYRKDSAPNGTGESWGRNPGPARSSTRFPIGTVALYGPDDKRITKIVAAVIEREGAEPILERWVGSNVKDDPKVQRQIKDFFQQHQVKSVVATDRNMGCPHEEGMDFPQGGDCPFCPFWQGKQGSNRKS